MNLTQRALLFDGGNSVPRAGLLLYLGRPNLEAADVPLGDDTEIGDDTIIRWMFLLPADADIRSATGWVSGTGNIFYDAAGDPVAVLASEIVAWSSINQWNVLFHLVSAETETGKLAIYAVDTPAEILDRAMKVLRAPQPDLPTAFFNGMDFRLATYTGGQTYVPDHMGVLRSPGANLPAVQGMRLNGGIYLNTDEFGNAILPSTPQKTVTYNTDWTAKTFAETFDKFDISDPLKAPGWLCEPVKTNYALNSATPATHTTGTLAVGTYTLWQEGTGSIVATAGTAVGTFGAASNDTPANITVTTAGTVVLTASGTNTWVQLELGAFKTSRIYTTTAPMVRAATIALFPTAGKIPVNNFAIRMTVVPRGALQSGYLWGSYTDASNFCYLSINPYDITFKSVVNGISKDVAIASYTHAQDVPFEAILCKSTQGSQLLVREYTGGAWQAWVRGGLSVTGDNLVLGSTYNLGGFNNSNQFTGNISEIDSLLIPSGIANPTAWVESQWDVNGAGSNPVIFNHTFTGLTLLDGVLQTKSATDSVTINWGDGTSDTYAGTGDTAFTHTYASATTIYNVTWTASDSTVLTKISYTDRAGGKVGGVLSLPAAMTSFYCWGSNTLSGVLSLPASMTYFNCYGQNTLSGVLSLPAAMTYFTCWGSNTLSGVLSLPAAMTSFNCAGSNTLSGVLSLPAAMTYFNCGGSNTLSGVLSLPASMTYFNCYGQNTLSGVLSLPAAMTYFTCWGSNTLSGVLSLPAAMTSFNCWGKNTLSGVLSLPTSMTYFLCVGSNTLSGVLSLPAAMTYFNCVGSNTLSGVLSLPAAMTYFTCGGSNTLSGVLSLPAAMTSFNCAGSNTLSGVLSLPAAMTYFNCGGSNTLSGVLSLPAAMTYFNCGGSNTLSGVLSLPAAMTYFTCGGSNTLSGYTPSAKAINQQRFFLAGLNTLSAANVDAIIQDYANAGGTWVGEKIFSMTVLTASNRTAASDAAWTTLGTKGLVIRTITLR